jgi:hypothetical protein
VDENCIAARGASADAAGEKLAAVRCRLVSDCLRLACGAVDCGTVLDSVDRGGGD